MPRHAGNGRKIGSAIIVRSSIPGPESATLNPPRKPAVWATFVAGLIGGILIYQAVLSISGLTVAGHESLEQQQSELQALQEENDQLFEELFSTQSPVKSTAEHADLPYDERADAHTAVAAARAQALEDHKYLMVTFGANWCLDCRNLYRILKSKEVSAYTSDRFLFVNVNVGKFNRNTDIAAELGVSLRNGIPVAIFFDAEGRPIGNTNEGQLEPARRYTSKQILRFVRDVAERSYILAPDAVR